MWFLLPFMVLLPVRSSKHRFLQIRPALHYHKWASIHGTQQSCRIYPFGLRMLHWDTTGAKHHMKSPSEEQSTAPVRCPIECRGLSVLNKEFLSRTTLKLMLIYCHHFNSSMFINYSISYNFSTPDSLPNTFLSLFIAFLINVPGTSAKQASQ